MNESEFVEFANRSIPSESRLRHITVDDIRDWTNKGFFKSAPNYYHYDLQTVLALLQLEREAQSRSSTRPQHIEPARTDVSRARDLGVSKKRCSGSYMCVIQLHRRAANHSSTKRYRTHKLSRTRGGKLLPLFQQADSNTEYWS